MWDLPRSGLEPASPALAGGLSTTAPPAKPSYVLFNSAFHLTKYIKPIVFMFGRPSSLRAGVLPAWFTLCPRHWEPHCDLSRWQQMFAEWMTWEDIHKTRIKSSPAKYAFLWCLPSINKFHTILSFYKTKWLLEYEKSRSVEFTRAANTQSKIFSSEATGKLDKNVIFTEETRQDVLGVVAPVSAAFLQEQESQKVGNKGYHRWKKR